MSNHFIFLIAFGFCALIFVLTSFFVYCQATKTYLWPAVAFGSGVLFSLIVCNFIPHALESSPYSAWIFIVIGFMLNAFAEIILLPRFKFLNRFWPDHVAHCQHNHTKEHIHYHFMPSSTACSALACLVLCAFFDGLRLASTTLLDLKTTIAMGLALLFHLIPESVTVLSIGLSTGFSKKMLLKINLLFFGSFLLGYQALFLLERVEGLKSAILPFSTGLFLYVSCVHLIPMIFKLKLIRPFLIGLVLCVILLGLSTALTGEVL